MLGASSDSETITYSEPANSPHKLFSHTYIREMRLPKYRMVIHYLASVHNISIYNFFKLSLI